LTRLGVKEGVPGGTAENMTLRGKTKAPDDGACFDVLENGEVEDSCFLVKKLGAGYTEISPEALNAGVFWDQ